MICSRPLGQPDGGRAQSREGEAAASAAQQESRGQQRPTVDSGTGQGGLCCRGRQPRPRWAPCSGEGRGAGTSHMLSTGCPQPSLRSPPGPTCPVSGAGAAWCQALCPTNDPWPSVHHGAVRWSALAAKMSHPKPVPCRVSCREGGLAASHFLLWTHWGMVSQSQCELCSNGGDQTHGAAGGVWPGALGSAG